MLWVPAKNQYAIAVAKNQYAIAVAKIPFCYSRCKNSVLLYRHVSVALYRPKSILRALYRVLRASDGLPVPCYQKSTHVVLPANQGFLKNSFVTGLQSVSAPAILVWH